MKVALLHPSLQFLVLVSCIVKWEISHHHLNILRILEVSGCILYIQDLECANNFIQNVSSASQ